MSLPGAHTEKRHPRKKGHDSICEINDNRCMSVTGFHVIAVLSKRTKFNSSYCNGEILEQIRKCPNAQRIGKTRRLIVHADNARLPKAKISLYFLEVHGMKKASHPPYSPD
jgi:hypothetical protein